MSITKQKVAETRSVTAAELAAMTPEEKAEWQQACYLERINNQQTGSNSDLDLIEGAC